MNKKLIRLTEGDLHRIVKESVKRIINELDIMKGEDDPNDSLEAYDRNEKNKKDALKRKGEEAQRIHPQRNSGFAADEFKKHPITKQGSDMVMNHFFPKGKD